MSPQRSPKELQRCPWCGTDPFYQNYHDTEWGVPHADDVRLFEKLVLEGFQSGLSWITILRKRENFRKAFHGFDAQRIVRYTDADKTRLLADEGIIRNRLKIDATIDNAKAYLKLRERQTLASFLWGQLDGRAQQNTFAEHKQIPPQTNVSARLSKALKKEGFRFVGPTTLYAFMQSVGMVNDHLVACHRYAVCGQLQKAFKAPVA
jgi:DNA-3-methyladenine glycosylase I